MENIDIPVGMAIVPLDTNNQEGLIEATLVEASPNKSVPPVVEAALIDDSVPRKSSMFRLRNICCLILAFAVLVVPLATGLAVALRKGLSSNESEPVQSGKVGSGNESLLWPTSAPSAFIEEETFDDLIDEPTPKESYSMEMLEAEPSPAPISLSPPAYQSATTPSFLPTLDSSIEPTNDITGHPNMAETEAPTQIPSSSPTASPTQSPTPAPSLTPSSSPSVLPSSKPSALPTYEPTVSPSKAPSAVPTRQNGKPGNAPPAQNKWKWVWDERKQRWVRVQCDGDC